VGNLEPFFSSRRLRTAWGMGGYTANYCIELLYKNIDSSFTDLMTHMTHKMPKASSRLGYRVGHHVEFYDPHRAQFGHKKIII